MPQSLIVLTVLINYNHKVCQLAQWVQSSFVTSHHCLAYREFHESYHSVTFIVLVNSHQRWKQMQNRVCFHLWCELTLALWCQSIIWSLFFMKYNAMEWRISWNSSPSLPQPSYCLLRHHEVNWLILNFSQAILLLIPRLLLGQNTEIDKFEENMRTNWPRPGLFAFLGLSYSAAWGTRRRPFAFGYL